MNGLMHRTSTLKHTRSFSSRVFARVFRTPIIVPCGFPMLTCSGTEKTKSSPPVLTCSLSWSLMLDSSFSTSDVPAPNCFLMNPIPSPRTVIAMMRTTIAVIESSSAAFLLVRMPIASF